jgi:hypothetical protein
VKLFLLSMAFAIGVAWCCFAVVLVVRFFQNRKDRATPAPQDTKGGAS